MANEYIQQFFGGEGKGPHMFDISAFLGKEETLRRTRRAIEVLG